MGAFEVGVTACLRVLSELRGWSTTFGFVLAIDRSELRNLLSRGGCDNRPHFKY